MEQVLVSQFVETGESKLMRSVMTGTRVITKAVKQIVVDNLLDGIVQEDLSHLLQLVK